MDDTCGFYPDNSACFVAVYVVSCSKKHGNCAFKKKNVLFFARNFIFYSAVFGLVEYVRGENIHRNCRLPLQLNMMLIGISVPLFMIWSKYLQGYFVTFDFRIISMLLSLIVSFVFFKINESKRLLLCILLVINMIIMLMGLVI